MGDTLTSTHYEPLTGNEILAIHQGVTQEDLCWLPDASRIIFQTRVNDSSEFWGITPDGHSATRLTVGSGGSNPRLSPDGKWLSYLSSKSGSREVWLHSLDAGSFAGDQQLTSLGADINSYYWAPDGHSIVFACSRYGSYGIYEILVTTGEWRCLVHRSDATEHFPVYTPDGQSIIYVRLNETWEDHRIVRIDRGGRERAILAEDRDFFDYQAGRRFGHPLISPNGNWLLFRSHRNNWINYWQLNLVDRNATPVPMQAEQFDQSAESGSITCGEAAWSPDSRHIAYVSNRNGNVQLRVTSVDGSHSKVIAAPDEGVASHPAWSPDGTQIAFIYQSFTAPPDVWVADIEEQHEGLIVQNRRQLTVSMPEALTAKFSRPEKIDYDSFDGVRIPAYIYRPPHRSYEPGPAIIEIHGGPVDQFRDTMHAVVQYYVQRGYTVLMPNIRGSAGYGKDFEELINTGWGTDDLRDVLAAARYLVESNQADPERIFATGQSYGGALSMALACSAPQGLFQAIISRTGYADWGYYYKHGGQRTVKLLRHSLGSFKENEERYTQPAALNNVHTAQTPIFVVDQESDPTQPHSDRRQEFVARLRGLGKPVKYKRYENTGGPYARHPAGAKEMLPDMMEYFAQYLS